MKIFAIFLFVILVYSCTHERIEDPSISDRRLLFSGDRTHSENNYQLKNDNKQTDTGLVLYFPFSGHAKDESGSGNHGYVHGAKLTTDRFANPNSAYYFDGIDDFIHVPFSSDFDFSDEKQLSFGCWADRLSPGFGYNSDRFGFFMGADENNYLWAGISASFYWIFIRHRLAESTDWYHCFITANDKTMKMYVNGIFVKQVSLYNVKWDEITMTGMFICAEKAGYKMPIMNFTKGKIDEIMIYNRVLTARDIYQIYSNGK